MKECERENLGCALVMCAENGFIETAEMILDRKPTRFNEYIELAIKFATLRGHTELSDILKGALT